MMMMPDATIPTNMTNSLVLTTFLIMMIDGSDNAVTAIIKANTVPMPTPFKTKASAIGNVPNISAYIGIPTTVASKTENGLLAPKTASIKDCGINP